VESRHIRRYGRGNAVMPIDIVVERCLFSIIYKVPDPLRSEEDCMRYYHHDLQEADRSCLITEQKRLELRLLLDAKPPEWLLERLEVVKGLLYGSKCQ
jgi:hypothetical protein